MFTSRLSHQPNVSSSNVEVPSAHLSLFEPAAESHPVGLIFPDLSQDYGRKLVVDYLTRKNPPSSEDRSSQELAIFVQHSVSIDLPGIEPSVAHDNLEVHYICPNPEILADPTIFDSDDFLDRDRLQRYQPFRNRLINPKGLIGCFDLDKDAFDQLRIQIDSILSEFSHLAKEKRPLVLVGLRFSPLAPLHTPELRTSNASRATEYTQAHGFTFLQVDVFGSSVLPSLASVFETITLQIRFRHLDLQGKNITEDLPFPFRTTWRFARFIDFRNNPVLRGIPAALGSLNPLEVEKITFDWRQFRQYEQVTARGTPQEIIQAANAKQQGMVLLDEVNLMLVGRSAAGKTSLLRRMRGKKFRSTILSTNGIDMGTIEIDKIRYSSFDFGGQAVYQYTHHVFLTDSAVYLLLFNLTDPPSTAIRDTRFWLDFISSKVKKPTIILIGTHADRQSKHLSEHHLLFQLETLQSLAPDSIWSKGFAVSSATFAGISSLLKDLRRIVENRDLRLSVATPIARLRPHLDSIRSSLAATSPLVAYCELYNRLQPLLPVSRTSVIDLTREAINVFQNMGVILRVKNASSSPVPPHLDQSLVVLSSSWLADLFASIITTRHVATSSIRRDAILERSAVVTIWSDEAKFPTRWHPQLLSLLEQCDLLVHLPRTERYLIPCMLQEHRPPVTQPSIVDSQQHSLLRCFEVFRVYRISDQSALAQQSIPQGFVPRLMSLILSQQDTDFQILTKWQQGFLIQATNDQIAIQRTPDQQGIFVRISTSYIPSLSSPNHHIKAVGSRMRLTAAVITQLSQQVYFFELKPFFPCFESSSCELSFPPVFAAVCRGDLRLTCPVGHVRYLEFFVPELLLSSFSDVTVESIQTVRKLGKGAFGSVNLVECSYFHPTLNQGSSRTAASKEFHWLSAEEEKTEFRYQEFLHEATIMSLLESPFVVQMFGVTLNPPSLLMEVVFGGDLFQNLNDPSGLWLIGECIEKLKHQHSNYRFFFIRNNPQHPPNPVYLLSLLSEDSFLYLALHQHLQRLVRQEYNRSLPRGFDPKDMDDLGHSDPSISRHPSWYEFFNLHSGQIRQADFLHCLRQNSELNLLLQKHFDFLSTFLSASQTETLHHLHDRLVSAHQLTIDDNSRQSYSELKDAENLLEDFISSLKHSVFAFDWSTLLKLATDIALGIMHLHSQNPPILHRDIKSPNIFLSKKLHQLTRADIFSAAPIAKIGDFGLSIRLWQPYLIDGEDSVFANINPIWGAPEVLSNGNISLPSDVYSFGIILWELVTRELPYAKYKDRFEGVVKFKVLEGVRPSFASHPDTPVTYQNLAAMCWHPNPSLRPTITDVYACLYEITQQHALELVEFLPIPAAFSLDQSNSNAMIAPDMFRFFNASEGLFNINLPHIRLLKSTPIALSDHLSLLSQVYHHTDCSQCGSPSRFRKKLKRCPHCDRLLCGDCLAQEKNLGCPEASLDPLWRVNKMVFSNDHDLWIGFTNGYLVHHDLSAASSQFTVCVPEHKHFQQVDAMVYHTQAGGIIWSGSVDGSIRVWSAYPTTGKEFLASNRLQGWVRRIGKSISRNLWCMLEESRIELYPDRHVGHSAYSIVLTSSMILRHSQTYDRINLTSDGSLLLSLRSADDDPSGLRKWAVRLNQVIEALRKNDSNELLPISAIAQYPPHQIAVSSEEQKKSWPAIKSLCVVSGYVWAANSDLVLTEWTLVSSEHTVGLRTDDHHIEHLRTIRIVDSIKELLPARCRTISHMIQIDLNTVWIACGSRIISIQNFDMSTSPEAASTSSRQLSPVRQIASNAHHDDNITTMTLTRSGEKVWTTDEEGLICLWAVAVKGSQKPSLLCLIEGLKGNTITSLCEAFHGSEMWLGMATGQLLRLTPKSGNRIRASPIPVHHSRTVTSILASKDAVFSGSWDQQLITSVQCVGESSDLSDSSGHDLFVVWRGEAKATQTENLSVFFRSLHDRKLNLQFDTIYRSLLSLIAEYGQIIPVISFSELVEQLATRSLQDPKLIAESVVIFHHLRIILQCAVDGISTVVLLPEWLTSFIHPLFNPADGLVNVNGEVDVARLFDIWQISPALAEVVLKALTVCDVLVPVSPTRVVITALLPSSDRIDIPAVSPVTNHLEGVTIRHIKRKFYLRGDPSRHSPLTPAVVVRLADLLRGTDQQMHLVSQSATGAVLKRSGAVIPITTLTLRLSPNLRSLHFEVLFQEALSAGQQIIVGVLLVRRCMLLIHSLFSDFYLLSLADEIPCQETCVIAGDQARKCGIFGERTITCSCVETPHQHQLDQIAPDLSFVDLRCQQRLIDSSFIDVGRVLGQGAFGTISQASIVTPSDGLPPWMSVSHSTVLDVALKRIDQLSPENTKATFELHREISSMLQLSHPNMIILIGICTQPPSLLIELASGGDLLHFLHDPFNLRCLDEFFNGVVSEVGSYELRKTQAESQPWKFLPPTPLPDSLASFPGYETGFEKPFNDWLQTLSRINAETAHIQTVVDARSRLNDCFAHFLTSHSALHHRAFSNSFTAVQDLARGHMLAFFPLPVDLQLQLAIDIARGLHFMHCVVRPPLLHRDLKSPNILLTQSLHLGASRAGTLAKLADFGMSIQLIGQSLQSGVMSPVGHINPIWAAPEILSQTGEYYGLPSDIYALGVAFFEIFTRSELFAGESQETIAAQILEGSRPGIVLTHASAELLKHLIEQCWLQDPRNRPDIQKILAQLESLSSSIEVHQPHY